jgi:hypothetical protein
MQMKIPNLSCDARGMRIQHHDVNLSHSIYHFNSYSTQSTYCLFNLLTKETTKLNNKMQDLERIERLRSLSHRIDCELERIEENVVNCPSHYLLLMVFQMRKQCLKRSMDELRKLEDEVKLSLNLWSIISIS